MSPASIATISPPVDRAQLGYELGRYTIPDTGERVLCGRRVRGEAIVIDAPADGDGRVYLVERDVERDGFRALRALVSDYILTATVTGQMPMARIAASAPPQPGSCPRSGGAAP